MFYDPHNVQLAQFLNDTNRKHVLIVGHSNTIPQFANALIEKEEFKEMEDNDNATLIKVIINGNDKTAESITVD